MIYIKFITIMLFKYHQKLEMSLIFIQNTFTQHPFWYKIIRNILSKRCVLKHKKQSNCILVWNNIMLKIHSKYIYYKPYNVILKPFSLNIHMPFKEIFCSFLHPVDLNYYLKSFIFSPKNFLLLFFYNAYLLSMKV